MSKPTINSFTEFAEIFIQKYERYLPTAFDESPTLLEKMNKLIEYLNKMGVLVNDLVKQWNEVMEWVLSDGLTDAVIDKLNQMVDDGTLERLINEEVFNNIYTNLLERGVNVKQPPLPLIPAKGDGVTNDTLAIQNIVNYAQQNHLDVFFPVGTYLCNIELSGWAISLYGNNSLNTVLRPYNSAVPVISDKGVQRRNARIENLKLLGNNIAGEIGLLISRNSYLCQYQNVIIENFDIGVDVKNSWGFHFDMFELKNNRTGMRIDSSSAVNAAKFSRGKISGNQIVGVDFVSHIGHGIMFDTCTLEGNDIAVQVASFYGNVNFSGCYFEHNEKHFIGKPNAASATGVMSFENNWFSLNGDSQINIQSEIRNFIFENNEVLAEVPLNYVLGFNGATYVKYKGNAVTGSGNITSVINGLSSISVLETPDVMRINSSNQRVSKGIFKEVLSNSGTFDNLQSVSGDLTLKKITMNDGDITLFDTSGYADSKTTDYSVIGTGQNSVDANYFYGIINKMVKTSGRFVMQTFARIRNGSDKKIFEVNQKGHLTVHGGFPYMYTSERNLIALDNFYRGMTVFDRDLNKMVTMTQNSQGTLLWVDSMGNPV